MQSASDSPSSQFAQVVAKPERLRNSHLVAKPPPERSVPEHQKLVARERVRPAEEPRTDSRATHDTPAFHKGSVTSVLSKLYSRVKLLAT